MSKLTGADKNLDNAQFETSTRTPLRAPPRTYSIKKITNHLFDGRHDGSRACWPKPQRWMYRRSTLSLSSSTVDDEEPRQSPIGSVPESKLNSMIFKETHNASPRIQRKVSWSDSIVINMQSCLNSAHNSRRLWSMCVACHKANRLSGAVLSSLAVGLLVFPWPYRSVNEAVRYRSMSVVPRRSPRARGLVGF